MLEDTRFDVRTDRLSTSECSNMRMLEEKCWPMLDENFDRNQTSSNIVQHDPTLPNMSQQCSNEDNMLCVTMLHPFKRAP